MNHNASGHSYLKRYLLFGLPHAWYKEGKHHILHKHLELVTEEATSFLKMASWWTTKFISVPLWG